jgi:hypothetical protein
MWLAIGLILFLATMVGLRAFERRTGSSLSARWRWMAVAVGSALVTSDALVLARLLH